MSVEKNYLLLIRATCYAKSFRFVRVLFLAVILTLPLPGCPNSCLPPTQGKGYTHQQTPSLVTALQGQPLGPNLQHKN